MTRTPKDDVRRLTRAEVDDFELICSQLGRFHEEMQSLAKGKSSDSLNEFKLKLLNGLLERAGTLLGARYEAVPGFSKFASEQLPSISDGLIVTSQYLGALEKLRTDNIDQHYGEWYWVIDGKQSDVRTAPPKKLK